MPREPEENKEDCSHVVKCPYCGAEYHACDVFDAAAEEYDDFNEVAMDCISCGKEFVIVEHVTYLACPVIKEYNN
jgi:DNA-directed RNA polymerase subunit RPC12/RpoP